MSMLRVDENRFAALLKQQGTSRSGIADKLGIDWATVANVEKSEWPLLSRLADRIGVNPILLVEMDGDELVVNTFAANRYIKDAGLTKADLAVELAVHRNTMTNLVSHRFTRLSQIAKAMGVSPMALLRVD